jgi:hypothetical protein
MFRIPEIVSFLKTIINIYQREEQEEQVEEEEEQEEEEEEDTQVVINMYIIIQQQSFENINSFISMFAAVFFAYYYLPFLHQFLFNMPPSGAEMNGLLCGSFMRNGLRQCIRILYLSINVIYICCFIYYMLTTSVNNTDLSY